MSARFSRALLSGKGSGCKEMFAGGDGVLTSTLPRSALKLSGGRSIRRPVVPLPRAHTYPPSREPFHCRACGARCSVRGMQVSRRTRGKQGRETMLVTTRKTCYGRRSPIILPRVPRRRVRSHRTAAWPTSDIRHPSVSLTALSGVFTWHPWVAPSLPRPLLGRRCSSCLPRRLVS